ncbi:hypothetical protein [Hwanghaeella sp.]|uniref:hypothetical protein n=1 Tax=Hwanghaeella sp. TaxID=2605943 RepID=UPI003CCBC745
MNQALIDTGRTPEEAGSTHDQLASRSRQAKGPARLSRNRIAVAFGVGVAVLAATTFVALRSELQQPLAITDPEALNDIAPASGAPSNAEPGQPAANIDNWGNAPELNNLNSGSSPEN